MERLETDWKQMERMVRPQIPGHRTTPYQTLGTYWRNAYACEMIPIHYEFLS